MATVDIGTIAGISIGATAPSNQAIIWYDTTDGLHKSYNQSLGEWVPMSQAIVAEIADFNDLINKANLPGGLPIGAFYHVVKRDSDANWNTMVWVVGSTRVQYVDKQNNIIVEDLAGQGTTTQYVASTNYFFDNVVATFDAATSKLNFQFQSVTDNPAMTDVLYGMRMVGENTTLVKRTIQSLISKSPKNSLAFVDGLYFNFSAAMKGVIVSEQTDDTTVIGYKQYTADYAAMDKVFKDVQDIVRDWQNNSREMIFTSKLIEVNPVTATVAAPQDLTPNDDITAAFNKIQGWYNRLKLATGASLSSAYAPNPNTKGIMPAAGDIVEKAIALLHQAILDIDSEYGESKNIKIGGQQTDFPDIDYMGFIDVEGSVRDAFKLLWDDLAQIITGDDTGPILKKLVDSSSIFERNVLKRHMAVGIVGGSVGFSNLAGGSTYNVQLGYRYLYNLNASSITSAVWTLNLGFLDNPGALDAYTNESVGGTIQVIVNCNVSNGQTLRVVDGDGSKDYNMASAGYYLLTAWATGYISSSRLRFTSFIQKIDYLQ
jgi:hypothetical protein|nr:MAG TPA: hypothetical protein [Caudoviricetes sp.]